MNRRSFLAGLVATTMRCSFGFTIPKVEIEELTWMALVDICSESRYGVVTKRDNVYYYTERLKIGDDRRV